MKKTISVIIACVLFVLSFSVMAYAADGSISVNGEVFDGTLAQAITAASNGGTVTISGTVRTYPIGRTDGTKVKDVTIEGVNNAKLLPPSGFISNPDDNLDIITVTGDNVTIKNLFIDACWLVDFPLATFNCDNILVENVTVQHGKRGGVNVMTGGNALFKNVKAEDSRQAGFFFESCGDASNVKFVNCSTSGNWYRSGVAICNAYGSTTNVDASGITCAEGYFSVHDRFSGSLRDKPRQTITFSAAPKNSSGNPIDTSSAMNYDLEKAYLCIRFGATDADTQSAVAYVDSSAYGFATRVYFDDAADARNFLHEGESVSEIGNFFRTILMWILRIFNALRIKLF